LTELSDTEPLPGEKRADATDDEDSSDEDSDSAATKAEGGTDKSLAEEGAKAGDAAHNKGEKASKFGGLLSGKKPQPKSAPAKPRVSRPKQSKPKSSGLAYDPMNGAL
jgi:hypothetical protein